MRRLVWLVAGLLLPGVAAAHNLAPGIGDFYAGAFNLVGGPVDVLVWVSLAGLAGLHAQRPAGWAAETFAAGLLGGLLAARWWQANARPELADAAVLLVAGGLLAAGRRLPGPLLLGLVAVIGAMRGWHYGADTLARPDVLALCGGLALAGYVLVACAVAVVLWFRRNEHGSATRTWRMVALRAAGSWISAIAILSGGFAMRHL
jgi:hydrogenase/urease accessory protein HupE